MINVSFGLNLPFTDFKSVCSYHRNLSESHVIEVEVNQVPTLVGLSFNVRLWGDHIGFDISISLFFFDLSASFYDVRHEQ